MQNRYRRSLLLVTVLVGAAVGIATQALAQFTQQGPKLVGTLPVGRSQQGYSVALSADGDIAIVGGPSDNSQIGAAWVYTRRGGIWHEHGNKLVGTGLVGNAEQGWSVALSEVSAASSRSAVVRVKTVSELDGLGPRRRHGRGAGR